MRSSMALAIVGLAPFWLLAGNMLSFDDASRVVWFVLGTIAATPLALIGLAQGSPWMVATSLAILLAIGFPLTIGATLFVAAFPAILVAVAARIDGLAPTPPTIGVAIATAGAVLLLLTMGLLYGGDIPPLVFLVGLAYPAQLAIAAAVCAWPRRRAGTAKRDAPHRAA